MKAMRPFQRDKQPHPAGDFSVIASLWQRPVSVELEIGAGVGYFALQWAKKNPEKVLLSFEHTRSKFESFRRRFENHGRPANLYPLHLNAIGAITHLVPDARIDRLHINYPNPNPKNPSLRWLRMPFFSEILRVLRPEGEIFLLTNRKDYFAEAEKAAEGVWGLNVTEAFSFDRAQVPGGSPRTHFEKKYLDAGETCYQLALKKMPRKK